MLNSDASLRVGPILKSAFSVCFGQVGMSESQKCDFATFSACTKFRTVNSDASLRVDQILKTAFSVCFGQVGKC